MSLLELVEDAQTKSGRYIEPSNRDMAVSDEFREKVDVSSLRKEVEKIVPIEKIAILMMQNEVLAKRELSKACKQVFSSSKFSNITSGEQKALVEQLNDVVFGLGPIEHLVSNEEVTEIMVNGSNEIFVERGGRIEKTNLKFSDDEQVRVLIDRIIAPLGRRIDEQSPMVNARLPQGHRVNAVIPPISPDGPHLTIRAFTKHVMKLEEMERRGCVERSVSIFLDLAVKLRKNVVVSGGTGSGKTTMLNALSCLIDHSQRVITIEDSLELKLDEELHVVRLESRPKNAEGIGEVTIRDLVKNALRMRPDRIIVGECRGGEALDMLQAMNTGHDGSLTTLHANSTNDVVDRMTTLVRYAVDLPISAIHSQIGSAFDYIIQVQRDRDGSRYLKEISDVSFDSKEQSVVVNQLYFRESFQSEGVWKRIPSVVKSSIKDVLYEEEAKLWKSLALD